MLDSKGFDLWADGYDRSVGLSDEENTYPFAGYKEVLNRIYNAVLARKNAVVCDIGFGTGVLTSRLYDEGCEIWGQDFSSEMLKIAGRKMPSAHLFRGDFSKGLAAELRQNTYDFIIATYSLHHLTDAGKLELIKTLMPLLKPDGAILIGDVMFETRADLLRCREEAGEEWDDEEIYLVAEELKKSLPDMEFTQISHCGGIVMVRRRTVDIRPLAEPDLTAILPLYEAVGWTNYTRDPEMLRYAFENSLLPLGAYDGDRLVGLVRAVGDGYSVVFVQDLLVLPEYQRRGIGSALLRAVLAAFPGVYQTELLTDDTPEHAAFYRSAGFTPSKELGCTAYIKM